jgi:predicted enzyme related to lactoylglutathione lyase
VVVPTGEFRFLFVARDYAATVAFYRDDIGLPVDHDWDEGPEDRGSVFRAASGLIEVFALAPGKTYIAPRGVWMLIQVADVDQTYRRLVERGLPVLEPPASHPWGHRSFRVSDPDGIPVALFSPVKPGQEQG